jgi:hypothetical protein
MYKIIAIFSFMVRFALLPNPFEHFKNGIVMNLAVEPVIHVVTYGIVGLFYLRGEAPSIGSFLYLLFYCINIGLILLWSHFGASVFVGVLIIVVYVTILLKLSANANEFRGI